MKIESINLKDFKRFKELTISDLPESAKLVILVGPNGCGKSSVFDAMNFYAKINAAGVPHRSVGYYSRLPVPDTRDSMRDIRKKIGITFHELKSIDKKSIYIRSAYRHVPSFTQSDIRQIDEDSLLTTRVPRLIDADEEVQTNYTRLIWRAANAVLATENAGRKAGEIADEIISVARESLNGVFPDLRLNTLADLESGKGTFTFSKGDSTDYSYENLSSGEKAAFDLLLDMAVKKETHTDTVYCIDEPESHMGLGVQKNVLKALFKMLPTQSQLWIATHSIGMLREAYNLQREEPKKVVFLNFDKLDFDKPQTIKPAQMDRALWAEMHKSALDDLADLVLADILYLCESHPDKNFDADCYNTIFSGEFPDVTFASVGSKTDVVRIAEALQKAMPDLNVVPVRDRDQMHEKEVEAERGRGVKILSRTCIEEYLLDDEVLKMFCNEHDLDTDILNQIRKIRDDNKNELKNACQNIRTHLVKFKKSLQIGDNMPAFLTCSLAPLLKPGMRAYEALKQDIFDE